MVAAVEAAASARMRVAAAAAYCVSYRGGRLAVAVMEAAATAACRREVVARTRAAVGRSLVPRAAAEVLGWLAVWVLAAWLEVAGVPWVAVVVVAA